MPSAARQNGTRTLYHSALRELSAEAPVRLRLRSHPQPSKYPGKPAYVRLVIEGEEDRERTYEIENEQIGEALAAAPLNEWLTVLALGKGDAAWLEINGQAAEPESVRRRTDSTPANRIAAAVQETAEQTQAAPQTIAGAYWQALRTANAIIEGFRQIHGREPTDAELRVAASLFIEASRSPGRPLSK